jgi:tripartite-type tricarboxylate transporter receptor subunit TctC
VPYGGSAQALTDLLAGRIDLLFTPASTVIQHVRDGKLVALAATEAKRAAIAPDVPTMSEAGLPGFDTGLWFGLIAPAGTPRAAIDWVNRETRNAFAAEPVRRRYLAQGTLLPLGSPEDFAAHIAVEQQKWGEVIRQASIRLE